MLNQRRRWQIFALAPLRKDFTAYIQWPIHLKGEEFFFEVHEVLDRFCDCKQELHNYKQSHSVV